MIDLFLDAYPLHGAQTALAALAARGHIDPSPGQGIQQAAGLIVFWDGTWVQRPSALNPRP